jgi:hypothetical protein
VKQEIQLAWKYDVPYLPALLEPIHYPEQIQYWLEGWQQIEVLNRAPADWLPALTAACSQLGVSVAAGEAPPPPSTAPKLPPLLPGIDGLWSLARFTDRIWPVPARHDRSVSRGIMRDLGARQEELAYTFRLGSRVQLIIDSDRDGQLTLLDQGTSGKVYCLCPSAFASDTRILVGQTQLPQPASPHPDFQVTGRVGREHLLAIVSRQPLRLDWVPQANIPARILDQADIDQLLEQIKQLEGDEWSAFATYFDVIP